MKITILIILSLIFLGSSCKDSTRPQPADCNLGFLPCEDDIEECCEVICQETYHTCGEFLTECCLEITSHNFSWEIDTIGSYGSFLRDVTIVDENNIWVVGNIETVEGEYNAAHWDGVEWELLGIYSNTLDLWSIHYISEDDIWVTDYCSPIHWDGNEWSLYHIQNMGLNACVGNDIWGTSSSNIYFVGVEGSIVHYDGTNFSKLYSGTDIQLNEIDGTTNGEYVFVAGRNDSGESIALMIHDNEVTTLYEGENTLSEPYGGIKSVSVLNDTAFFASNQVLWNYNYIDSNSRTIIRHDEFSMLGSVYRMKTEKINDISIMSNGAEYIHFNGQSWFVDSTILNQFGVNNVYGYSIDHNNNMVAISGYCCGGGHAIVARGYR